MDLPLLPSLFAAPRGSWGVTTLARFETAQCTAHRDCPLSPCGCPQIYSSTSQHPATRIPPRSALTQASHPLQSSRPALRRVIFLWISAAHPYKWAVLKARTRPREHGARDSRPPSNRRQHRARWRQARLPRGRAACSAVVRCLKRARRRSGPLGCRGESPRARPWRSAQ